MNNLDLQYQNLLQDILDNGVEKETRNGKTLSIFGYQIRHQMAEGFPLLTTKKMAIGSVMAELKWFLKGRTDVRYLNENGCNIWNGDAFKYYLDATSTLRTSYQDEYKLPNTMKEFIERIKTDDAFNDEWGYLGPIYGKQWRDWNGIDQIKNLIEQLKTNPDSRRLVVSAWNVNDLPYMTLPPCHYGFQVYTRELSIQERMRLGNFELGEVVNDEMCDKQNIPQRAISLMFNMRSNDVPLGLPFNLASYGMLLELLGKEVNMIPDELICNLGDVHIYVNQVEGVMDQLGRVPFELPTVKVSNVDILNGEFDYQIQNYQSHPSIKIPLSN
jgi:thymidylate synthase